MHFAGNRATKKVDLESPALIIPVSSNYPNVDIFFFNPVDRLFLACQFTILNPFTKHSQNFFDIRDFNTETLWRHLSGDKIKTVRMLWVTTNKNAKDYKNNWVTTHTELGGISCVTGFCAKQVIYVSIHKPTHTVPTHTMPHPLTPHHTTPTPTHSHLLSITF
jgi:hypothetical protein